MCLARFLSTLSRLFLHFIKLHLTNSTCAVAFADGNVAMPYVSLLAVGFIVTSCTKRKHIWFHPKFRACIY